MEHAVNMAQEPGMGGIVRVNTLPGASRAYKAMAFRHLGLGVMELDPSKSDKWEQAPEDGKWRLAKHADKKYIEAFGQAEDKVTAGSSQDGDSLAAGTAPKDFADSVSSIGAPLENEAPSTQGSLLADMIEQFPELPWHTTSGTGQN